MTVSRWLCESARLIFVVVALLAAGPVLAEEGAEQGETSGASATFVDEVIDFIKGGKPILDVNLRWEYGKIDDQKVAHSSTVRTRLGYQTKPLKGFSGLLEFVNVTSPRPSAYYDGTGSNSQNRTIVADPEVTDINRAWLGFDRPDWYGSKLKAGRQRIILDDARWIGNVGWRQNEQRFDSARGQTSLGIDDLNVQYVFVWNVKRIFGDQGSNTSNLDYTQATHLLNVSYDLTKELQATAFAYLIDPNNLDNATDSRALNHSTTFGLRLTGKVELSDKLDSHYEISYAYQSDWRDNPIDYDAHYYKLVAGLDYHPIAAFELGYEVLGSDDGKAVIATPFATAHKFNGYADAFLNNGGPRGLRDVFISITPAIPIDKLKFTAIVHQFYSDQGSDNLGQEYDAVATYDINQYLQVLYKVAYYDESDRSSPKSRVRSILQTTFKF